ncbi:hypothetical protein [Streptomyces sp. NBRC 110028]|uniref:hypothetical protein n=1 Tax=Streptomyces sp. NBRC 110028 TaxID=1621260 RepID=UPI000AA0CB5D|nr:hypothetical protein [Streptomyces sp. NBRC 110028]
MAGSPPARATRHRIRASACPAPGGTSRIFRPSGGIARSPFAPTRHQLVIGGDSLRLDVYGGGSGLGRQVAPWPRKNTPGSNQDFTPR